MSKKLLTPIRMVRSRDPGDMAPWNTSDSTAESLHHCRPRRPSRTALCRRYDTRSIHRRTRR